MNVSCSAPLALVTLFLWCFAEIVTAADTNARLREFASLKREQIEELAARLHYDVPVEARAFFKAAEAGDYVAVSNAYAQVQRLSASNASMTGLTNALNVPIHETWGAYEEVYYWYPKLLRQYAEGILDSMPSNSVYFGGTDPGRFVITMYNDTSKDPHVVVLTPKFVITQNVLAENRYMDYLRLTQGERLWLPSTNDVRSAFQQCIDDIRERQRRGERLGTDERVEGSNTVRGVVAVMNINGIISRMIFEDNKAQHPFFVEESYVIAWMYPFMEPHGLILKLNKEELPALDPKVVNEDTRFWDALTAKLLADRSFTNNIAAQKTYSKLRSAIGGLYAYRRMTPEAEAAFKQALELCPISPEANFRLAQLYMESKRYDAAIAVMDRLLSQLSPGSERDKVALASAQIRDMKRKAEQAP